MAHRLRRLFFSYGLLWSVATALYVSCGRGSERVGGDAEKGGEPAATGTPKTLIPEEAESLAARPRGPWRTAEEIAPPEPVAEPSPERATAGDVRTTAIAGMRDVPNVVLIVVDTMRADFTSLFPDEYDATPFLADLAKKSVLYRNAFSTAPWTVPAMYSMMTGLFPSQHGMDAADVTPRGEIASQSILSEKAYTLAEQMREMGYGTFGVCTNHHLAAKYGMAQGFEHFVGSAFTKLPFPEFAFEKMAPEILASGRYFLWMHYIDPHHPYGAIHPWVDQWNHSGISGYDQLALDIVSRYYRYEHGLPADARLSDDAIEPIYKRAAALARLMPLPERYFIGFQLKGAPPLEGTREAKYLEFLKAAYASEIRAADESIRDVMKRLRIDDDDLVIVTSDHGEEFMEHGRIGHRFLGSLSQELVHIPLLIKYPGNRGAGTAVEEAASLVDIIPTIRGVLGQRSLDELPGEDLSKRAGSVGARPQRTVFCELKEVNESKKCAVEYPWKLLVNERSGRVRLFDIASDPNETSDISAANPAIVERLEGALAEWARIDVPMWKDRHSAQLTEEEKQQLRALGYMSSFRGDASP